jgi:Xaa-Pro aminopeptidase
MQSKRVYQIAHEHIMTNMELIKPGVSFEEITQKAHRLPKKCRANRYGVVMHMVSACVMNAPQSASQKTSRAMVIQAH